MYFQYNYPKSPKILHLPTIKTGWNQNKWLIKIPRLLLMKQKIIKMLKDSFVLHIRSVSVKRLSVSLEHNLIL